jgi:protein SCO1/2
MASLLKLQEALDDRLGRDIFMYLLTLLPEMDTPQALNDYAKKYGIGPGWTFLTK